MGGPNKLLAPVGGAPMVRRVVETALGSGARPVTVVTGHQADAVAAALADLPVELVNNPDFAGGLSTSLRRGVAALPADTDGAVVCLGDMPALTPGHIDRLIASFNPVEGRAICVPTVRGKRGNPVLIAAQFFPEIMALEGDIGARHLIGAHADQVCEVPVDALGGGEGTAPIHVDIDTAEALAAYADRQPA
jgi:molybdenum cofactor cytidylyltransferase